ncbi:hypothetical protein SAMN05660199_03962 [Klenkia soli]|uniref:Uncharacterized protein n=1 Tax=Klenkia soli TaxID=1052260 RepID=A0A1H0SY60_9ACTN|nr:hypothetical protein [Klenkia soli]SDP46569.1 hypothetical protein SAMN05660199_03962 [Klenkia soli]
MAAIDQRPETLRVKVKLVLERWSAASEEQSDITSRPKIHPAHLLTVWGLTAHVFNQGRFLFPHLGVTGLEIAPIVRSQFETALTVQWIVLRGPKALPGFLNEGVRQRVNLGRSMQQAGWGGTSPELIERLAAERVPSEGLDDQAKNLLRMVECFKGHESLYALYRFMSGLSHPSASVVDEYANQTEGPGLGVELMREAQSLGQMPWEWSVLCSLVWAGRALDYISHESPDRHFYNSVAREAGMGSAMLQLTPPAAAAAFVDQYNAGRRRRE